MVTDNQRRSRKQEARGAKVYGGRVNSGSGNTDGFKNDVRTKDLSIEFKTTKQKSYNLRLDALRVAEKEALLSFRDMLFGIDFETPKSTFRYVVLTEMDYLLMHDRAEDAESDLEQADQRIRDLELEVEELDDKLLEENGGGSYF